MNMNILSFIKVVLNSVFFGAGTHIANSCTGRFFHNIAKVAGKFNFAAAIKNSRLYLKHISADGSPRKPVDKPYGIFALNGFRLKLLCPEILCYITGTNYNFCCFFSDNSFCRFAAECTYGSFKIANTGLSCIIIKHRVKRIIRYFKFP